MDAKDDFEIAVNELSLSYRDAAATLVELSDALEKFKGVTESMSEKRLVLLARSAGMTAKSVSENLGAATKAALFFASDMMDAVASVLPDVPPKV